MPRHGPCRQRSTGLATLPVTRNAHARVVRSVGVVAGEGDGLHAGVGGHEDHRWVQEQAWLPEWPLILSQAWACP